MTAEEADKKREDEMQAATGEFVSELGISEDTARALFEDGIYSLEELAYVPEQEIAGLGLFSDEELPEVREKARTVLLARALKREENLRQADPSLFALEGMDNDLASKLVGAGVKTADELGDLDTEELVEKTGLDEEAASKLIMAARASWAE